MLGVQWDVASHGLHDVRPHTHEPDEATHHAPVGGDVTCREQAIIILGGLLLLLHSSERWVCILESKLSDLVHDGGLHGQGNCALVLAVLHHQPQEIGQGALVLHLEPRLNVSKHLEPELLTVGDQSHIIHIEE